MRKVVKVAATALLITMVSCGGGGGGSSPNDLLEPTRMQVPLADNLIPDVIRGDELPDVPQELAVDGGQSGLPAFPPGEVAGGYTAHSTSAAPEVLTGIQTSSRKGLNNLEVGSELMVIAGGEDDLGWAMYHISDLTTIRPTDLQISVTPAVIPGGDDDLPLSYWIGVSDYSKYAWEWSGPFTDTQEQDLNGLDSANHQRMTSKAGDFYYVVVVSAASGETLEGYVGVKISTSTTSKLEASDPEYVVTVPHSTPIDSITYGNGKAGSALDPDTQYVTLEWTHFYDQHAPQTSALSVRVIRRNPAGVELEIGTIDSLTNMFVDPVDNTAPDSQATPGIKYVYFIRSFNSGGWTTGNFRGKVEIPILPPTEIWASQGTYPTIIRIKWEAAEGADTYRISRGTPENLMFEGPGSLDGGSGRLYWDDQGIATDDHFTYYIQSVNTTAEPVAISVPSDGREGWTGYAPTAVVAADIERGTPALTVDFDGSGSSDSDGSIAEYLWYVDGVLADDSTWQIIPYPRSTGATDHLTWLLVESGIYHCRLVVVDDSGKSSPDGPDDEVAVLVNWPPQANLTRTPAMGNPPLVVTLDATGSTDLDGSIIKYWWDWDISDGDDDEWDIGGPLAPEENGTDLAVITTAPYATPGTYTARVRLFDDAGNSAGDYWTEGDWDEADVVIVVNAQPTADFTATPEFGVPPLDVDFDASFSTDDDGTIAEWHWDFNGDGHFGGESDVDALAEEDAAVSNETPSFNYATHGEYNSGLKVVDDQGSISAIANVEISVNTFPVCDLQADPEAGAAPLSVDFDATSSTDDDGDITQFEFDFDDGGGWQVDTDGLATYIYTEVGEYHPQLRLTDDDGAVSTTSILITAGGQGDWWMFGREPTHNRRSPYNGPATNAVKWSFPTGGDIRYSSPAIAADGTIYIGSADNKLYAINPDGTAKGGNWPFTAGGSLWDASPAIATDGTVYVGCLDNKLYAINPDGTEKWNFPTGGGIYSSPTIAADGTLYFGSNDQYIYALNPDGTEEWSYLTAGQVQCSPAIASDGTIYAGALNGKIYALNPDGTALGGNWPVTVGGNIYSSPAIGADGTIYEGSDNTNLYAINPDGTIQWTFPTGSFVQSSPAIAADGTIYVGSNDDNLYAINPDGTEKWSYFANAGVGSSPAIGADGTVYVAGIYWSIYAINPDGSLKWSYETGASMYSSPAIGEDGTVYVGSIDDSLYAFGPGNGPVAVLDADPTDGSFPLLVNFDASDSFDVDGAIVNYEWDFDGNGVFNEAGNEAAAQGDDTPSPTYNDPGVYDAVVRVTDNDAKQDIASISISASGTIWKHTWGLSGDDKLIDVAVDDSGNIYAAGSIDSEASTLLLKYDSSGALQWAKTWGGAGDEQLTDIALDTSGNIYASGMTYSFGTGGDCLLLKYSPSGSLLWEKVWGGSDVDIGVAIVVDATGNVFIAGTTSSFGGYYEMFLLKYLSTGTLDWRKTWTYADQDYVGEMALDADNNIYIVGAVQAGFGASETRALKYNSAGVVQWCKAWGGTSTEVLKGIDFDSSGNIFVSGYTDSAGNGREALLMKYSPGGTLLWNKTWGESGDDSAIRLCIDDYDNIYLGGRSDSFGAGNNDCFLLKYNTSGTLALSKVWGSTGSEEFWGLALDANNALILAGLAPDDGGSWQTALGIAGSFSGSEASLTGTEANVTGTAQDVTGTEGTPTGTEDSGGGGDDTLVVKAAP